MCFPKEGLLDYHHYHQYLDFHRMIQRTDMRGEISAVSLFCTKTAGATTASATPRIKPLQFSGPLSMAGSSHIAKKWDSDSSKKKTRMNKKGKSNL